MGRYFGSRLALVLLIFSFAFYTMMQVQTCFYVALVVLMPLQGQAQASTFACSTYKTQCVDTNKTAAYGDCAATVAANTNVSMTCRTEHLGFITAGDDASQTTHCTHAAPVATGPCVNETLTVAEPAAVAAEPEAETTAEPEAETTAEPAAETTAAAAEAEATTAAGTKAPTGNSSQTTVAPDAACAPKMGAALASVVMMCTLA